MEHLSSKMWHARRHGRNVKGSEAQQAWTEYTLCRRTRPHVWLETLTRLFAVAQFVLLATPASSALKKCGRRWPAHQKLTSCRTGSETVQTHFAGVRISPGRFDGQLCLHCLWGPCSPRVPSCACRRCLASRQISEYRTSGVGMLVVCRFIFFSGLSTPFSLMTSSCPPWRTVMVSQSVTSTTVAG
jgi:hypothetical protein